MLIICAAIDDQLVCNIDGDAYVKGYGLPVILLVMQDLEELSFTYIINVTLIFTFITSHLDQKLISTFYFS